MKKILFLFIALLALSACKNEEVINQLIVPDYNNDGEYVLDPLPGLLGNVKITIWPSFTSSEAKLALENRGDKPVGFIIRDRDDLSFVYFSDSYIAAKKTSTKYGTKLPFNEALYFKVIAYNSTLSYGLVVAIESLGLDFWTSIADYRDNLQAEYEGEIILIPQKP